MNTPHRAIRPSVSSQRRLSDSRTEFFPLDTWPVHGTICATVGKEWFLALQLLFPRWNRLLPHRLRTWLAYHVRPQPQPFEPGLERAGNDQGQVFRMKKPSARLIALATLGCLVVHIRASSVLAADNSVLQPHRIIQIYLTEDVPVSGRSNDMGRLSP